MPAAAHRVQLDGARDPLVQPGGARARRRPPARAAAPTGWCALEGADRHAEALRRRDDLVLRAGRDRGRGASRRRAPRRARRRTARRSAPPARRPVANARAVGGRDGRPRAPAPRPARCCPSCRSRHLVETTRADEILHRRAAPGSGWGRPAAPGCGCRATRRRSSPSGGRWRTLGPSPRATSSTSRGSSPGRRATASRQSERIALG